jgi:hypothetical protein
VGVNQSYAASEAMPLALPCRYGWLRLNSDWFLVEPIDPEGRTWYGRSLASRGKDSQCLSAYHPVVRRCSEVMVSAISCTKLDVEGGGVAGTFDLVRSGGGDGRCEGAGQADDAVGGPGRRSCTSPGSDLRSFWSVAPDCREAGWASP